MLGNAMSALFRRPFRFRLFLDQMQFVGVGSLPIIMLVGFFSGAVSAQQAITALRIFNQERFVGATVGISLAQELAPVFTGLMITARAGSGMATELGSMRITEQIDALSTFAVDPIQYLVTPRVIATTLIMPIMGMVFNIVGLLGAYLFSIYFEHIDLGQFIEQFTFWTDPEGLHHRRDEGAGVRDHPVGCCLLPGLLRARRRQGGRPGDHPRRGLGLGLDPGGRLLSHRRVPYSLALPVNQPPASTSHPPTAPAGSAGPAGGNPLAQRDERWQIRVRGLNKTFGPQHVLRGIDLDIERGRTNIIIGGSGQGKSVLMKHLMGLLRPDSGQIWVDGVDVVPFSDAEMGKLRRKYGMVFQYAALFDSMNVVENIAFPLIERYNLSRAEIMERVRDLLRRLDLANVDGIEQKIPPELSGGQRKRVGLARALIDRPEILLYDEPTTGLDPVATKNVDEMIRRTADDFGVTSVVISHDMASTFRIGDRISMLDQGKIVVSGTSEEVLVSRHPALREFVETSGLVAPEQGGQA